MMVRKNLALLQVLGLLSALVTTATAECISTLDFEQDGFGNPTSRGQLAANMWSNVGITISTSNNNKPAMLFDTANPTGQDEDLRHATEGMVLIISEDGDQNDPDDNAGRETVTFTFADPVGIESLGLLDLEEQGYLSLFDSTGARIGSKTPMPTMRDGETKRLQIGATNVARVEVEFHGSGALTDLEIDCTASSSTTTRTAASPTDTATDDSGLGECQADCDRDDECKQGLLCADAHKAELAEQGFDQRKAYCGGSGTDEVCYDPNKTQPQTPATTDDSGLGECEADCDRDDECKQGLLCADAHKAELADQGFDQRKAYCGGSGTDEVCYDPAKTMPTNPPTGKPTMAPDQVTAEDRTTEASFSKGDPHFKTHSGEMYDFHGGCDLVLLEQPNFFNGLPLTIHIRTKIHTWWSYVSSAVVQYGDLVVEINGADEPQDWLYINGELTKPKRLGQMWQQKMIGDRTFLRYKDTDDNTREVEFRFGPEVITMKTYFDFVKVELNARNVKAYEGSLGLLGRHPDGARVARDGTTLIEDVNAFGQAWQVLPEEPKLFHTYEGNDIVPATEQCRMPIVDTIEKTMLRKRRLEQSDITQEKANKACGHLKNAQERRACVYDVLATQDLNMGSVW